MGIVSLGSIPIVWPTISGQPGSLNSLTIDADGEEIAFNVRMPEAGTINRVGFLLGTVAQAPTSLTVSLQDPDSDGNPDGTADQTRVVSSGITSNAWVETGLITSDGTDTGTKRTVTAGQVVQVVISNTSFTLGDDVDVAVRMANAGSFLSVVSTQWASLYTTSWQGFGSRSAGPLVLAIQYDDNEWKPIEGLLPISAYASSDYAASSTPDEKGMKFTAPGSIRVTGFAAQMLQITAATSTGTFHLYDTDDTELASADLVAANFNTNQGAAYLPFEGSAVTLLSGATYRVTLEATGAGTVRLPLITLSSSDYQTASPWGSAQGTSRSDAGAWTDTATEFHTIGLLIDGVSDGSGGGSIFSSRHRR